MGADRVTHLNDAYASTVTEWGMFSAASFAGVITGYQATPGASVDGSPSPRIIAFYGFRGGAGRTTALAHVAALLSARQVSVVAIDLDLEAPGLHHVLACPELDGDFGVLALLRAAATVDENELDTALLLKRHVVRSQLDVGAPIRVLPAGRLSQTYLERLENIGVPLWHIIQGPSPLEAVIRRVREELAPQVICLDCRTGLSGVSASAVFHVADVVVCFVPVSGQSIEGLEVFFKALKAAQTQRGGIPDALIVPSMVPEGPEGQDRLADFVQRIEKSYAEIVLGEPLSDENATVLSEQVPVIRDGIEYRRGIALADSLRSDFVQRSAGAYQALIKGLDGVLKLGSPQTSASFNVSRILGES